MYDLSYMLSINFLYNIYIFLRPLNLFKICLDSFLIGQLLVDGLI